jgi:hypothetical protein
MMNRLLSKLKPYYSIIIYMGFGFITIYILLLVGPIDLSAKPFLFSQLHKYQVILCFYLLWHVCIIILCFIQKDRRVLISSLIVHMTTLTAYGVCSFNITDTSLPIRFVSLILSGIAYLLCGIVVLYSWKTYQLATGILKLGFIICVPNIFDSSYAIYILIIPAISDFILLWTFKKNTPSIELAVIDLDLLD